MFGVLFFTLSFTLVCASDRRLINQINNLKEDLSYVNRDISSLFKHFDVLNTTIWSNLLGNPMKGREEHVLEQIEDLSDKESLTAMLQHEMMNLIKGFQTEKKLNRRLLIRLETSEKQNTEKEKMLNAERMDMQNIKDRLNAEIKTRQQITSDFRKELAQLQNDYVVMKDEFSQLKVQHAATKDELSELNSRLQINDGAMKGEFLELVKNISTIVESCDVLSKSTPNVISLPESTTSQTRETTTHIPVHTSCKDQQTSGVYDIIIENSVKTSVYCDADTDAGGWIVIMRRKNLSVNFTRTWEEYKNGFGVVDGQFWMGNEVLHQLTKTKPMELRVDMEERGGNKVFAKYAVFKVGSEADKYVLTVSGYSGTAGDGLDSGRRDGRYRHNGMKFSTFDQDNDRDKSGNCAGRYGGGGWWYNACTDSLLTGTSSTGEMYMFWYDGERWRSLKFAEMKIR